MANKKILAIIPARGGSRGVKRKNIKLLGGKPLVYYILKAAQQSRYIDRLIVSTDDKEIAAIARKYKAEVPFLRPKALAQDETPIVPVLKHAMDFFDKRGWHADIVATLQPTNPFITTEVLDKVFECHVKTGCDAVATISRIEKEHPFRAKVLSSGGKLNNFLKNIDGEKCLRRQTLPELYAYNGAAYTRKRKLLEDWDGRTLGLGKDIRGVLVPGFMAWDINNLLDFKIAEILLKGKYAVDK